jgi:molybdopterin-guanine dinucleotide biosynthesis protein A
VSTAAIVLAGGQSRRMGRPKALLDWHGSTLVRRTVGLVAREVDGPVVVVRARGQPLPALPPGTELADDAREARGPLEGMAAGFAAIGGRAQIVFVAAVDAPLMHPALVRHVIASLRDDDDVALPQAHGFPHPLAAAYRAATIAPLIDALLEEGALSTRALMQRARALRLDDRALLADAAVAALDPQLESLHNLNEPGEYAAAHALPEPPVTVEGRGAIRAATLARASGGPATINGRLATDPQEPLVAGDVVVWIGGAAGA